MPSSSSGWARSSGARACPSPAPGHKRERRRVADALHADRAKVDPAARVGWTTVPRARSAGSTECPAFRDRTSTAIHPDSDTRSRDEPPLDRAADRRGLATPSDESEESHESRPALSAYRTLPESQSLTVSAPRGPRFTDTSGDGAIRVRAYVSTSHDPSTRQTPGRPRGRGAANPTLTAGRSIPPSPARGPHLALAGARPARRRRLRDRSRRARRRPTKAAAPRGIVARSATTTSTVAKPSAAGPYREPRERLIGQLARAAAARARTRRPSAACSDESRATSAMV